MHTVLGLPLRPAEEEVAEGRESSDGGGGGEGEGSFLEAVADVVEGSELNGAAAVLIQLERVLHLREEGRTRQKPGVRQEEGREGAYGHLVILGLPGSTGVAAVLPQAAVGGGGEALAPKTTNTRILRTTQNPKTPKPQNPKTP